MPVNVEALTRSNVDGLVPLKIVSKGKLFQLFYDITGYIPMESYLKSGLRKQHFAALLDNTYFTLQSLQASFFSINAILLSINQVFISPVTKKTGFIFIPIQFYTTDTNLRDFFHAIVKNTTFSQGEKLEYVDELTVILNRGINVSLFDLEEYIHKISERPKVAEAKNRCKKCSAVYDKGTRFCPSCGIAFNTCENRSSSVYDPLTILENVPLAKAVVQRQSACNQEATPQKVPSAGIEVPAKAWLIQKRTGKVFAIDEAAYKIGKSDCNCNITDNPIISRVHAKIVQREGHYFVVDLFSTNKTYLNGQQIPAQKELELLPDSVLCFGNEEFEFKK